MLFFNSFLVPLEVLDEVTKMFQITALLMQVTVEAQYVLPRFERKLVCVTIDFRWEVIQISQ